MTRPMDPALAHWEVQASRRVESQSSPLKGIEHEGPPPARVPDENVYTVVSRRAASRSRQTGGGPSNIYRDREVQGNALEKGQWVNECDRLREILQGSERLRLPIRGTLIRVGG